MSHLHDPQDPRHNRLFDLLQQQQSTQSIAHARAGLRFRKATAEEIETIKATSARALARRN